MKNFFAFALAAPLGVFVYYLIIRLGSYAICQSIKQVFYIQPIKEVINVKERPGKG